MPETIYSILLFSGADRRSFLQGQLTQELHDLHDAISLPAAWCNAKGRVIVTCRLLELGDSIGMALPASMSAAVADRLALYRFRADVAISAGDMSWKAMAVSGEQHFEMLDRVGLMPDETISACRRLNNLITVNQVGKNRYVEIYGHTRDIETIGLRDIDSMTVDHWQQERIAGGIVDIALENTERFTPHMLNLDLIGAVSFSKGCYTGQEVVARTENLGSVKRRLLRYGTGETDAKIGDKLERDGRDIGSIVNVGTHEILAVTPLAQHAEKLNLRDGVATPLRMPYEIH